VTAEGLSVTYSSTGSSFPTSLLDTGKFGTSNETIPSVRECSEGLLGESTLSSSSGTMKNHHE